MVCDNDKTVAGIFFIGDIAALDPAKHFFARNMHDAFCCALRDYLRAFNTEPDALIIEFPEVDAHGINAQKVQINLSDILGEKIDAIILVHEKNILEFLARYHVVELRFKFLENMLHITGIEYLEVLHLYAPDWIVFPHDLCDLP